MSDGVTLEVIKWFALYIAVILVWMWNTQKLAARDYVTAICAALATPLIMQLIYTMIPFDWHSMANDLLIMLMLYLILHMLGNTIRRAIRTF